MSLIPPDVVARPQQDARPSAVEVALGNPWGDGSIRFDDIVADERRSRLTPELRRTLFDELDLGSELVPTAWRGSRPDDQRLVRELRPLFRRDPAIGVEVAALPLLATAGMWASPACSLAADELRAGRQLAVALSPGLVTRTADGISGHLPLVAVPDSARYAVVPLADQTCLIEREPGEGVSRGAVRPTTGLRGIRFTRLEMKDMPVVASWTADGEADAAARAMVGALWCGTVDTALRIAVTYASARTLYGGTVWDIPHARSLVATACLDVLTADAVAKAAYETGTTGALGLVPVLLNDAMKTLSVLFGSTFFARVEPYAVFETFVRDVASMRLLSFGAAAGEESPPRFDVAAGVVEHTQVGPQGWQKAAGERLQLRSTGKRGVLSDDTTESLSAHVARCTFESISITSERVRVFAPPMERENP